MHRVRIPRAVVLLGAITILAGPSVPGFATPDDPVSVVGSNGAANAPLPENLAVALSRAGEFARKHGQDLAHPWADRTTNTLVVTVATDHGRGLVRDQLLPILDPAVRVRVASARHSHAALEAVKDAAITASEHIVATYVDAERNRVLADAGATPDAMLRALGTAFGDDALAVRHVPGATPMRLAARNNDVSPFKGGAVINTPRGGCTSGIPWQRANVYAMITAGHCVANGGAITTPPATAMGTVTASSHENWNVGTGTVALTGQTAQRGDQAYIAITSPGTSDRRTYVGGITSNVSEENHAIFARRSLANDLFCTGGAVTGEVCSYTVTQVGANIATDEGTARNVVIGSKTGTCNTHGDSGGPVFRHGTTNGAATVAFKGVISAVNTNGGCQLAYTDVWDSWDAFGGFARLHDYNLGNTLWSLMTMHPGYYLQSPDGRYQLRMQIDGNLVLYKPGNVAVWSSGTNSATNSGAIADMQTDGNFVLYRRERVPIWSTNTAGRTNDPRLVLQNDCNLVIYAPTAVWASNTQYC